MPPPRSSQQFLPLSATTPSPRQVNYASAAHGSPVWQWVENTVDFSPLEDTISVGAEKCSGCFFSFLGSLPQPSSLFLPLHRSFNNSQVSLQPLPWASTPHIQLPRGISALVSHRHFETKLIHFSFPSCSCMCVCVFCFSSSKLGGPFQSKYSVAFRLRKHFLLLFL